MSSSAVGWLRVVSMVPNSQIRMYFYEVPDIWITRPKLLIVVHSSLCFGIHYCRVRNKAAKPTNLTCIGRRRTLITPYLNIVNAHITTTTHWFYTMIFWLIKARYLLEIFCLMSFIFLQLNPCKEDCKLEIHLVGLMWDSCQPSCSATRDICIGALPSKHRDSMITTLPQLNK